MVYFLYGIPQSIGGYPLIFRRAYPSDERREGLSMVTYADLFPILLFIVALIGLIYQILKDKRK